MSGASIDLLAQAVAFLAVFTLGISVAVYLLMDLRHRQQLQRQARRVTLAAHLIPPLTPQALHTLWSRCNRASRKILEEILTDRCRLAEGEERSGAAQFLMGIGIYDRWLQEIRQGRKSRRAQAARKLGYVHDRRGVEALVAAAGDSYALVRLAVALSLGRLKDPAGLPGLIHLAQGRTKTIPDLTLAAALAACAEGCSSLIAGLLRAPHVQTRVIGAWALSEVADETSLPALSDAIRDPDPEVRAKVARALGRVPEERSLNLLSALARDPVPFVRVRALDALGKQKSSAAEPLVLGGLDDHMPEVRNRAAAALRQIYGMKAGLIAKVHAAGSRRSFNTLISEWERAGFLHTLVAGLITRDWVRFVETQETIRVLIAAGMTQALVNMVLVFPGVKVRLRLLRLLVAEPRANVMADLLALIGRPGCDPRVAQAIRKVAVMSPPISSADIKSDTV